jgi:RNA polymerase sigma factor (TIGR02999 family)
MEPNQDVTVLLQNAQAGDHEALDQLLPLVYGELKRIAAGHLRRERSDHTLQATALVHEAYLRLVQQHSVDWRNRAHFFAIAAEMMRRILVNYAVQQNAEKRGGKSERFSLDDVTSLAAQSEVDLLLLDEALKKLVAIDASQARIVELRFFGGLTVEEVAAVLGISERTVKRDWRAAKAWLHHQISATAHTLPAKGI